MRKKILLTTDFSKNAWNAIVYTLELYKNSECEFYILNTFKLSGYVKGIITPQPGEANYDEAKAASEDGLTRVQRMITFREENNSKHTFKTISILNSLLETIIEVVEEKDIELVVMGTKGKTDAKSILFGSNSINAMEKVRNCPLLVVPEVTDSVPPKEIVFPTSYKTHFKRREFNHLIEIAKISNASIRVLHVSKDHTLLNKDEQEHKELLEEYFEGLKYSFHTLSDLSVKDAVHSFVQSRDSDMIAFINKKHTVVGSFLAQPLANGVVSDSKVPVLVLHDLRN